MASKQELIDIRMRLLGAKEVAEGTGVAKKGIKGVGDATRTTARHSTKAAKANSVLTKSYGALGKAAKYGLGFIGVGGVFALESAVTNTLELAKVTTGLNRNLGLSVKESSRWATVAHARGIASSGLTMGMTKLGKSFVEANRKGGTARTGLNMLGITQAETAKGAHDFNYALGLVADKFGEAQAGPKRQTAAMALLGKGYSTLLPLFSSGNKGLQEQLHWADKYGVTLSGKTNDALMDMVNAQRESKVAMLGLQVSMTKALMPAIDAGEGQLQKFIATLNDPKLTSDQKILRIEKQFEDLENFLLKAITDALPKVAEQGGELGVKLGGAVWAGFKNSGLAGKIVISAWLFKFVGGFSLLGTLGGKIGGKLARSLGTKFLETVAPYFAAEAGMEGLGSALGSRMPALKGKFGKFGGILGRTFALGFITIGGFEIANWLKEETDTKWTGSLWHDSPLSSENVTGGGGGALWGDSPLSVPIPGIDSPNKKGGQVIIAPGAIKKGGSKHTPRTAPRRNFSFIPPIHVHTHIDGKEVALTVARHAEGAAARA